MAIISCRESKFNCCDKKENVSLAVDTKQSDDEAFQKRPLIGITSI